MNLYSLIMKRRSVRNFENKDAIPAKLLGMKSIAVCAGLHRNQKPRIPFELPDTELGSIGGMAQTILRIARE